MSGKRSPQPIGVFDRDVRVLGRVPDEKRRDTKEDTLPAVRPNVISRYFQFEADREIDEVVALFADDATVVDERETMQGTHEIRAWLTGTAWKYTYTTEVTNSETVGPDRYRVTGRLTGNFPGGTADLKWDFTIADGYITRLVIAP